MSVRATWSTFDNVDIEVTDEFTDQHGSSIDEGGVAVLLGQDQDCFVIEGADIADLREFLKRLRKAIDTYDHDHPADVNEVTC